MQRLLRELKTKPLSGADIERICDGKVRVVVYRDLRRFRDIDELFGDVNAVALLYEMRPGYGHWVALTRRGKKVEFFDPYGYAPDEELKFVRPEYEKKLGASTPVLSEMLYHSPYRLVFSNAQLQKRARGVASCGRHVAMRCVLADVPLEKYVKLVKSAKGQNPDDVVTQLTAFI